MKRWVGLSMLFWIVLLGLVAIDWQRGSEAHSRFEEPAAWALGQGQGSSSKGAHCAAVPQK